MAYATYTTEALVCGNKDSYTSDRSFLLFTYDAGMIWATARSVREERSKQRCALQDFTLIRVSLVRGKGGWRIGSVSSQANVYAQVQSRQKRGGVTRIVRLLRQFIHGETPHRDIFSDVQTALQRIPYVTDEQSEYIADILTLRVLHMLGYIASKPSFAAYLEDIDWCTAPESLPREAEQAITNALHVSHL